MAPPEICTGDGHLLESALLVAHKESAPAAEYETTSLSTGRKKSEASLRRPRMVHVAVAQLREVFLGTKLFPLFSVVPIAVAAEYIHHGRAWVFAFNLIGLAPLAERVSFLSEQIANTVGPTVGGLLNATCGNVPELIIALFALHKEKMEILKWSLLGSILSNLLLVLGSSLLFGGLANIGKELPLHRRQADVSIGLLLLGILCHISAVASKITINNGESINSSGVLKLSRTSAVLMLTAYIGGLFFQLKTHRQIFEQDEALVAWATCPSTRVGAWPQGRRDAFFDDSSEISSGAGDDDDATDAPVIGFMSAVIWLLGMTAVIAMLSNYIVTTIEEASESFGIPLRSISIVILPIVGNAAEHAGAVIFAFKNKIDITLGIALGSASQISMLVVPVVLIVSWANGIPMDLDFNLLETGTLVMTVITTAFALQDDKWHYLKGFNLVLSYVVIAVCFFTMKAAPNK